MPTVGIRELRNKLSLYLKQVEQGKQIEVMNRGEVIALLVPAKRRKVDKELMALVEEGIASWTGRKPKGALHLVKGRGLLLSEIILNGERIGIFIPKNLTGQKSRIILRSG